jgi:Hyaluronidase
MQLTSMPWFRAVIATVLMAAHANALAAKSGDGGCVRVFDAMYFKGKPDLSPLGVEKLRLFASLNWWPDRRRADELPPRRAIGAWLRGLPDREQPFVIDLEHWPVRGSSSSVAASLQKKATLVDWVRSEGYAGPIGYYGLPPIRDYWRAIRPAESAAHRQWRDENDRWQPLVTRVDYLFPSLYTFYDDPDTWATYAIENIAEARRLARGKPVYPFLWPQYHNSNRNLAYRFLPAHVWRRQLEMVAEHADGIVLWGGSDEQGRGVGVWNPTSPWWVATLDFLTANRARCRQS